MPSYSCPVNASADDFDYTGSASTTLVARYINSLGLISQATYKCNCGAVMVGHEIITGLTTTLYEVAYTASRGISKEYKIQILTIGGAYVAATSAAITYIGSGLPRTISLPSTFWPYVDQNGYAWMRILVEDPGGANDRVFTAYSYDLGTSANIPRVNVTTIVAPKRHVVMAIGA